MKVITELNTGIIIDIADNAVNTSEGVKVTKNGGIYYIGYEVDIHDVAGVPQGIAAYEYIFDGTDYFENENYKAPFNPEDELQGLKAENTSLQDQITELQLAIAELAGLLVGGEA